MTAPPLDVVILGATGSIGTQALDVIDRFPERFRIFGLVSGARHPGREAPHVITGQDPDFDARVRAVAGVHDTGYFAPSPKRALIEG